MKPKVLHIVTDLNLGGINTLIQNWQQSSLSTEFNFLVAEITQLETAFNLFRPQLVLLHSACSRQMLPKLLRLLGQQTKLIIFDHHYCSGFEKTVPSKFRLHLMLRLSYRLAYRVVAVSQGQSQWMLKNDLVAPEKLYVLPPIPNLQPLLNILPVESWTLPLNIGAYGRFTQQKGFDILLRTLQKYPELNITINLVGDGPDAAQLHGLAEGLSNVKISPATTNVSGFMASCQAIIIPSRWEPWGLACVEAKAAARPVIVSDVDGLSEQMNDCGILVQPDNIESLAAAFQSLTKQSPSQLEQWGNQGRASVINAWENHIKAFSAFLWDSL
ncbi:glycosyltransferase family 4 protein [Synechococcus sp. PCC 6312]|uniref:glycosyltransferase family 4 protein n=1 Tax=Synechococcus sp. (strain ATCC 27167 / PCC 6312) TaxID=195253 RepID=UPI00029EECA9|nr:glycosyltransferase family 4 protein [Synechococcus sp. PCC 6312]AFY59910.1 glycosyltransferase [Synechococcus sp. PCC 6312]